MHLAQSEIRMKYKEGGLAGGAVALDNLFRVIILAYFMFQYFLLFFCFDSLARVLLI